MIDSNPTVVLIVILIVILTERVATPAAAG